MLTFMGYIDGIHGAPYIAAPWILCDPSLAAKGPESDRAISGPDKQKAGAR